MRQGFVQKAAASRLKLKADQNSIMNNHFNKRGRNHQRRRQGVNPNRALDSNGPDVRIRGTAQQIYDKYLALARDAASAGDRVKAENYLQHAEHYFRVLRSIQGPQAQPSDSSQEGDFDGDQPQIGESRDQRPAASQNVADEQDSDIGGEQPEASSPIETGEDGDADQGRQEQRAQGGDQEGGRRRRRRPRRPRDEASGEEPAENPEPATA